MRNYLAYTLFAIACFRAEGAPLPLEKRCLPGYARLGESARYPLPRIEGQRAGIEIEGEIPRNISMTDVLARITQELREIYPGDDLAALDHFAIRLRTRDGEIHAYQFVVDASILPRGGMRGQELVSPILATEKNLQMYAYVLSGLRRAGFRPTRNAGLHIHIDFPQPTVEEILRTADAFARIENELMQVFRTAASRHAHIEPQSSQINRLLSRVRQGRINPSEATIESIIHELRDRERTLNFDSIIGPKGTLEFRLFNSTVDEEAVFTMLDFSLSFVRATRDPHSRLSVLLSQRAHAPISLQEVMTAIGARPISPRVAELLERELREDLQSVPFSRAPDARRARIARIVVGVALAGAAAYATVQSLVNISQ